MQLLWSLFLSLSWRPTAGEAASAENLLHSSPRAFSFEDLPPGVGTLSTKGDVQTLSGVRACECRVRCLTKPTCRGYGTSDTSQTCLLTELLPTLNNLEASSEDWRWSARRGVRLLGEPCDASGDCSLRVPGAVCTKKVCQCRRGLERDGDGGCRKTGGFIEVQQHQLTSSLISDTSQPAIDACQAVCDSNINCIAFDYSTSEKRCKVYAEGVTNEVTSSIDVRSFVWNFAHADGTPPESYTEVGNNFLGLLPAGKGVEAASACFLDGAILFPNVTKDGLAPLKTYITSQETTNYIWIGVDDLLEENRYITSGGRVATDILWDSGQPNGHDEHDCLLINRKLVVHDGECPRNIFHSLCQYVGENLALKRSSWMSSHFPSNPASMGNDGNIATTVHTPQGPHQPQIRESTWTVDLGGPVQVASVLYVARKDCCDDGDNRNRLTEIRVGSDPSRFDERHSARCVWLEEPFVIQGHARMFRCTVPLTGRYVRLIRHKPEDVMDFAELAVFGNRLGEF